MYDQWPKKSFSDTRSQNQKTAYNQFKPGIKLCDFEEENQVFVRTEPCTTAGSRMAAYPAVFMS